jgi:hypothetical protein
LPQLHVFVQQLARDSPSRIGVPPPDHEEAPSDCRRSESFGPLTQVARPVVAAKSPTPIVESATISIEEIAI